MSPSLVFCPLMLMAAQFTSKWQLDESALHHLKPEEQSLVREYALQWPHVFEFYSNLELTGSVLNESFDRSAESYERRSGVSGNLKVLGNSSYRLTALSEEGEELGLAIVTPEETYAFSRIPEAPGYALKARLKTDSDLVERFRAQYGPYPSAPEAAYANGEFHRLVYGIPIPGDGGCRIDRMELKDSPDGEVVEATVVCRGANWCRLRVFRFLRGHSWVTVANISAVPDSLRMHYAVTETQCEYDVGNGGMPHLRNCSTTIGTAAFGTADRDHCRYYDPEVLVPVSRSSATVQELVPGPPSPIEFDVKPYIRSVGGLGQQQPPRTFWKLMLANVVGLIALLVLFWVRNRALRK